MVRFYIFFTFLALWTLMWLWIYPCHIKNLCASQRGAPGASTIGYQEAAGFGDAFMFEWSSAQPIKSRGYNQLCRWYVSAIAAGKCVSAQAHYYSNESGPDVLNEIAVARALNATDLLPGSNHLYVQSTGRVLDSTACIASPIGQLLTFHHVACTKHDKAQLTLEINDRGAIPQPGLPAMVAAIVKSMDREGTIEMALKISPGMSRSREKMALDNLMQVHELFVQNGFPPEQVSVVVKRRLSTEIDDVPARVILTFNQRNS